MSKSDTSAAPDVDRSRVGPGGELVPWEEWLDELPLAENEEDVSRRVVEQILNATDDDQLSAVPAAEKLAFYLDEVIVIHDARIQRSTFEGGVGAFAIVDFTLDNSDEHKVASVGGPNVLAFLVNMHRRDRFPIRCKLVQVQSKANPERKINHLVTIKSL